MSDEFILQLISLSISLGAIVVSIIAYMHVKKDSSTSKTISCLTDLFSEYKMVMRNINTALLESEELLKYLEKKDFSDFNKVYYSGEYKTFREVGYFYELLGTMTSQNEINKESVLHCFSFPIEFFRKTKKIRDIITGEKCLPAYWENFQYLCALYNAIKEKNGDGGWIVNGKLVQLSPEEKEELPHLDKKDVSFCEKHVIKQRALARIKKANKYKEINSLLLLCG
jgi:hypothetical protein